jgi:dTDP-4-amino-4,6-dideoxygalactose transaminase
VWERYDGDLRSWAAEHGIQAPTIPKHCQQPYHMYYLLLPSLEARQALIRRLRSRRILAVFHYLPLHLSEMGRALGGRPGQCPVTETVSDRLLRLPFYTGMTESEQSEVIEAVIEEFGKS